MKNKFYITTTLPYVNASPHIGFALEIIHADIIARYHALRGDEVFFNTGTDEHGLKIYRNAQEANQDPQAYTDEYAAKFRALIPKLGISQDVHFIRTTDEHHILAAQEFWRRCESNGDIYRKKYSVKYCVGCELEKTDSELVDGKCPIHSNLTLEAIEEENYFFRFSKYQEPLLAWYAAHPDFVVPESRLNEIKKFVEAGLQDFSISRLKEKMPWGVPVPGDESQVMYVWFDALVNYISTLGWPSDSAQGKSSTFEEWWGTKEKPNALQVAGKDNLRQQSAMWQAMLMSAGLPLSRKIMIHGFITGAGGQKMSKSLGNVVDPFDVVDRFGVSALRYWVAREASTFEDSSFTWEQFHDSYNGNLANGLGNLASRTVKMAANAGINFKGEDGMISELAGIEARYDEAFASLNIQSAAHTVWEAIGICDRFIQKTEPFRMIKTNREQAIHDLDELIASVGLIARLIAPILPDVSAAILGALKDPSGGLSPLFPRLG